MTFKEKAEIVIRQLRRDRDRLLDAIDNIRAEIEAEITPNLSDEQTQAFAYVLQIIDKYKADSE